MTVKSGATLCDPFLPNGLTLTVNAGGTIAANGAAETSFSSGSTVQLNGGTLNFDITDPGAASATLSTSVKDGAAIGSWTLPAVGGYGVLSPKVLFGGVKGEVSAALSFDGTEFWTCDLLLENLGTAFIIR